MAPGPRARVLDTAAEARKRYSGLIALRPPRVQSIQGLVEYAPGVEEEDGRVEEERETGSLVCQDNDKEAAVEDDDELTALPIMHMSEVYRPKPLESIDVGDNGPKTQGRMDGRAWWRSSSGAMTQQYEELRPGMMHGDYDGVVLVPPSVRRGGLPHPNGLGGDEIEFLIPAVPSGRQSRNHPRLEATNTSTEVSVQDTSTETSSIASQQREQGWRAKLIWLCCGLFFGDKRAKQRNSAVDIPLMQGSSFATDKTASGEENVSSSTQRILTNPKGAVLESTNKEHAEDNEDEDDGQEMTFEQMLATAPPDATAILPTVPYRDVGGKTSRRKLLKKAMRKAR